MVFGLARAGAQAPQFDPGFSSPGLGGRVFALTEFQGDVYAAGYAHRTDRLLGHVARFDGTEWHEVGAAFSGAVFGPTQRHVRALAVFNNELIAGGAFTAAGGVPATSIASWNGSAWRALGTGLTSAGSEATVYAMAVFNGELWVGGDFDSAGGQPIAGLARWNGTSWQSGGTLAPDILGNLEVVALEVVNGVLYAGGKFSQPGNNVACYDGVSWSALGAGTDATVRTFTQYQGQLVVGGGFSTAGGQLARGIAFWNGSAWSSPPTVAPSATIQINDMVVFQSDLYVTGSFGDASQNFVCFVRWDGAQWQPVGGIQGVFAGTIGTTGLCLHATANEVVIGGEFTHALRQIPQGPGVVSRNIVAFDGQQYSALGDGGLGIGDRVLQLAEYEGDIIAVGEFVIAGLAPARRLARFDGDEWREMGRFEGGNVRAVTVFQGDLYAIGSFTSVDGMSIQRAARWDGSQWNAWGNGASGVLCVYQGQLYQGAADKLFVWNGAVRTQLGTVPGEIEKLHVHDGALYVAAWNVFQPTISRWDGATLTQFATPDDTVRGMTTVGQDLVAFGSFSTISGVSAPGIARFDGSAWQPYIGGLSVSDVYAVAVLDGVLYAGDSLLASHLVRWTGASWQSVGTGIPGAIHTLLPDPTDGSLWIGGYFSEAGGLVSDNLARWQTQPAWRNYRHGLEGATGGPQLSGRGSLAPATSLDLLIETMPNTATVLGASIFRADIPAFGGVFLPSPDIAVPLQAGANGRATLGVQVPGGLSGIRLWLQAATVDASAPQGFAFTNALAAIFP